MMRSALACAFALIPLAAPTQEPTPNALYLDGDLAIDVRPDGDAVISWRTLEPTPPGTVSYGGCPADADIAQPRYRWNSTNLDADSGPSTAHSVSIELTDLEDEHTDIGRYAANGGGTVEIQLEAWSPRFNQAQLFPARFAYRRDAGGTYRRVPAITIGPVVDCVTERSAIISWETDLPARGQVILAPLDGAGEVITETTQGVVRGAEIEIGGLPPGTRCNYTVQLIDPADDTALPGRELSFTTAPRAGSDTPFAFAFMSDSRAGVGDPMVRVERVNYATVRRLMAESLRQGADLMLFAGDLVSGYTASRRDFVNQLNAWREAAMPVSGLMPIYEGMGNHEALGPSREDNPNRIGRSHTGSDAPEAVFSEAFVNPRNGPAAEADGAPMYGETAYSFDWGNAHFVSVNSNYWWDSQPGREGGGNREGFVMGGQLAWLDRNLRDARSRGQRHLFVYTHEPTFPTGGHLGDGMYWRGRNEEVNRMRDEFVRICSSNGVLAVLHGDEHNYSRTLITSDMPTSMEGASEETTASTAVRPMWQIISGGAGAPFYSQDFDAPWLEHVRSFSPQYHFVLFEVEGDHVRLRAISDTGQVLDEADLTAELGE